MEGTLDDGQFPGLKTDLKSIPLWPNFQVPSADKLKAANHVLLAASPRLLVPWMRDRHRFVSPQVSRDLRSQDCLLKLGVKKLSNDVLLRDYVLPLPSTLSSDYWTFFGPLIDAIVGISSSDTTRSIDRILKNSNIAADGNRTLKRACDLYDHQDEIFVAAFRGQETTMFLHDSLRANPLFWGRVGLRQRVDDFINFLDYLECLRRLESRLTANDALADSNLEMDTRKVLTPLTSPSYSLQRFAPVDWQVISQKKVFLSKKVFNAGPDYRKNGMAAVATQQHLLRLSDIISYDHVAVCWSQTAFPVLRPTVEGRPKADMVWRHLQHLKNSAQHLERYQLHDFLTDLHLTYEYLQDYLQESQTAFNLKSSAIWLNLSSSDHNTLVLDDVKSSWYKIDQLVLSSSCDAGEVKAVRQSLMRFDKLLRGLGCNTITYPTIIRPELHLGRSALNSLRQLRNDGKLVDITYSTEGKIVKAHRVVLAAMSEKCAGQFSGRWMVENIIKYDEKEDPDNFLSYHTLSTMIKYAYEDEIDWKEMEVVPDKDDADKTADKLELLLDLLKVRQAHVSILHHLY